MDYTIYKFTHFIGIFMVVASVGGICVQALAGGTRGFSGRKLAMATHGFGLLLVLFGGFGMMAKLAIPFPWPGWLWIKLAVWLALGAYTAFIFKKQNLAVVFWLGIFLMTGLAAYSAVFKPFN